MEMLYTVLIPTPLPVSCFSLSDISLKEPAALLLSQCRSLSGLLPQNTTERVAYEQQKLIPHSSGGGETQDPGARMGARASSPFIASFHCVRTEISGIRT